MKNLQPGIDYLLERIFTIAPKLSREQDKEEIETMLAGLLSLALTTAQSRNVEDLLDDAREQETARMQALYTISRFDFQDAIEKVK